jgi:hypothetical protein
VFASVVNNEPGTALLDTAAQNGLVIARTLETSFFIYCKSTCQMIFKHSVTFIFSIYEVITLVTEP